MRPLMRSLLMLSFVYCYQIYKDLKMSFHHKNYRNSCLVIVIIRFIVISLGLSQSDYIDYMKFFI
jgi:hypothetical protein